MRGLSLKTSFKIALRGKWVTRVITILLSAFSFALVAIASTGFLFNRTNFYEKAYRYYFQNTSPFVSFIVNNEKLFGSGFSEEWIKKIEEETNLPYLYDSSLLMDSNVHKYINEYDKIYESDKTSGTWFGNERSYNAVGFQVLAGRYPQNEYEVALSEQHYDLFVRGGGYVNVTERYKKVVDGKLEDGSRLPGGTTEHGYWFDFVNEYDEPVIAVTKPEDLIGKELVCYGDPQTGDYMAQSIYKMKIVGVIDTKSKEYADFGRAIRIDSRLLLSEKWLQVFRQEVKSISARPQDVKSFSKSCVALSIKMAEDYQEKTNESIGKNLVGERLFHFLTRDDNLSGENLLQLVCGVAGVFFGIFAALLNGHLIAASLELKRKQVGVLRSMGASEKSVRRIFMLEALFIGLCSFTVALGISLGVYYGWLKSLMIMNAFNACAMIYNGWTVLFLAVISLGVPVLCSLLPLKKFFKKPIVDNISGSSSQK